MTSLWRRSNLFAKLALAVEDSVKTRAIQLQLFTEKNLTKMGFDGPLTEANLWALGLNPSSCPLGSSSCLWSFVKLLTLIWLPSNLESADCTLLGSGQAAFQQLCITTNSWIVMRKMGFCFLSQSGRLNSGLTLNLVTTTGSAFFLWQKADLSVICYKVDRVEKKLIRGLKQKG